MQKSIELGKSIGLSNVYKEFKQAENDLLHNSEACKLVEDLQKLKSEHHGKKMAGIEISEKEQQTMKELEQSCLRDRQVLITNEANSKFQDLMSKMTENIKTGIKSAEQG
ncbi:YlbF family regulator [Desulfosporosinus fructosivorans]|uniref:YlbF family regulator n=2 Tax=Desulfosporosinus fructosivorans TaxID=2018669 RepID=A0A4Z0QWL5_9FIRM|nr:YlbF family regulator [Desulfosporosinus fructosivorans]